MLYCYIWKIHGFPFTCLRNLPGSRGLHIHIRFALKQHLDCHRRASKGTIYPPVKKHVAMDFGFYGPLSEVWVTFKHGDWRFPEPFWYILAVSRNRMLAPSGCLQHHSWQLTRGRFTVPSRPRLSGHSKASNNPVWESKSNCFSKQPNKIGDITIWIHPPVQIGHNKNNKNNKRHLWSPKLFSSCDYRTRMTKTNYLLPFLLHISKFT